MRWLLLVPLLLLGACEDKELVSQHLAMKEEMRKMQAAMDSELRRIKALHDQLAMVEHEKEEALVQRQALVEKLEKAEAANAALKKRVEEAELRVLEMEEMHKEVKKLE